MCMSYKAYQKFRQKLPSFKTFCRDAAFALADNTTTTSVPGSTDENDDIEASNSGNLKLPFGYKKRIHFETGKEWKELRLSKPGTHKMVSIEGGFQRCCEMCCRLNHDVENIEHTRMGYKTRYACDTCKVSLCRAKRWGGEESCFDKFHSERKLTDPCKHPDAMQPTKRNVNRAPPPNRKRSQLSDPPSRRAPSLRLKIKERRCSLRLSKHERKLS
ncbi:hypothetical protein DVH05_014458 [Phytophthora capsici]|nr:hypothetical protein DVH05_014458 [Phytophthora capsici]